MAMMDALGNVKILIFVLIVPPDIACVIKIEFIALFLLLSNFCLSSVLFCNNGIDLVFYI